MKKLYLVEHHQRGTISCIGLKADSRKEALFEAKCYLSEWGQEQLEIDSENYYLTATKIESLALMYRQ